jgi:hypothetical protein
MITTLLVGFCLMALCVTIHAGGSSWALRRMREASGPAPRFWANTSLFILVAAWMMLLHLCEISVWAVFYFWQGAIADLQSALYFSGVTYTTTGYGDLVLPDEWRLVGAIEALTGILLCGWSTGFFFAIVARLYQSPSTISGS